MAGDLVIQPASIASGGSLSAVIDVQSYHIVGFLMPAGWSAASLTLLAAVDDTSEPGPLYDMFGSEIAFTVTTNSSVQRLILVPPGYLPGVRRVRLQSGVTGSQVAQSADRAISIIFRRYS